MGIRSQLNVNPIGIAYYWILSLPVLGLRLFRFVTVLVIIPKFYGNKNTVTILLRILSTGSLTRRTTWRRPLGILYVLYDVRPSIVVNQYSIQLTMSRKRCIATGDLLVIINRYCLRYIPRVTYLTSSFPNHNIRE